jgi:hypothetical protein
MQSSRIVPLASAPAGYAAPYSTRRDHCGGSHSVRVTAIVPSVLSKLLFFNGHRFCVNRSSILWLAARRKGIARCAALHLDRAPSAEKGRVWIHAENLSQPFSCIGYCAQRLCAVAVSFKRQVCGRQCEPKRTSAETGSDHHSHCAAEHRPPETSSTKRNSPVMAVLSLRLLSKSALP